MSLISEINNTNTQKENIKTVANNIDNKLVSLGGQSATDLSKVPEKIQQMVTKNYKKYARIKINKQFFNVSETGKKTLYFNELDFLPKEMFLTVCDIPTIQRYNFTIIADGTQHKFSPEGRNILSVYTNNITKKSVDIELVFGQGLYVEEIIAIG